MLSIVRRRATAFSSILENRGVSSTLSQLVRVTETGLQDFEDPTAFDDCTLFCDFFLLTIRRNKFVVSGCHDEFSFTNVPVFMLDRKGKGGNEGLHSMAALTTKAQKQTVSRKLSKFHSNS